MPSIPGLTKEQLKQSVEEMVKHTFRKTLETASTQQIYNALAHTVKDHLSDAWIETHDYYEKKDVKVVYYLSMEFLMGRFLGNTLLNISMYDEVRAALEELGVDINLMEESEADPGLGSGGLGRLAACFLDSLSTLGYPAYGCGIRYQFGIFEQQIENGYQVEKPDDWLKFGDPWSIRRDEYAMEIKFGGRVNAIKDEQGEYRFVLENYHGVLAIPYDYPVVGYKSKMVNTLRLWDAQAIDRFDLKSFNEGNYRRAMDEQDLARTLTDVLYPADEFIAGKELRLKQQYFFISATLQRVMQRFEQMHKKDFKKLPDKVQFQLNDTHPTRM